MKLNLGSGNCPLDGYVNLDGKDGQSIFPLYIYQLSWPDVPVIDEIRASHVLEHFGHSKSIEVLANWIGVLKIGGVLKIAVPDFDDLIRRYNLGEQLNFEGILMGGQTDERDYHKSIWTLSKLRMIMEGFGLKDIQTWQSEMADCASYPFSLNLMGIKQ